LNPPDFANWESISVARSPARTSSPAILAPIRWAKSENVSVTVTIERWWRLMQLGIALVGALGLWPVARGVPV